MSSLRRGAASGVLWTALQMWTMRLTTVGAFVILSRQLSPAEFGLVALAMAVIAVLGILSDTGLATFVIQVKEINQQLLTTAFWTSMFIGCGLALLLAVLAVPAARLFGEPDLGPVLQVLAAGVVLTGLNSVPTALMRRQMRFKSLAIRGTSATIVGSVVAIVLAVSGAGVWALIAQSLVRNAISAVFTWTATRWVPSGRWDPTLAREMLGFGTKLLTIDLLNQVQSRGEEFALAAIGGAASLGTWSVANRILRIIQETSSSVVTTVATPTFARMQDDTERLFRAYGRTVSLAGMAIFPAMLVLAAVSADLVPWLLGVQWELAGRIAQFTALSAAFAAFNYFDRPVFVALGHVKTEVFLVIGSVVSQLLLVLVFAPHGLVILAIALLGRSAVLVPVRFITLARTTGMPYRVQLQPLRVLVAAMVAAAASWLCHAQLSELDRPERVIGGLLAAIVVYPVALLVFARGTTLSMISELRQLLPRRLRGRRDDQISIPRQAAPEKGVDAHPKSVDLTRVAVESLGGSREKR